MFYIGLGLTSLPMLQRAWNPEFLGSKLLEGWDVSREGTVTVSDAVDSWTGFKKGLVAAGVTTTRPSYNATGLNGKPCISGNGSQYLTLALSSGNMPSGAEECEVWILCSQNRAGNVSGLNSLFTWGNTGATGVSRTCGRTSTGSGNFVQTRGSTGAADIVVTGTAAFDGISITRHVFGAELVRHELDGAPDGATAGTLGGTAQVRLRILANASTTAANIALADIAMIYVTEPLTDAEAASMLRYMAAYGGVSPF